MEKGNFIKGSLFLIALGFVVLGSSPDSSRFSLENFVAAVFSSGSNEETVSPYIVRNLTLDTRGKTLLLDETAPNHDGRLIESDEGGPVRTWKVKYEQKGNSRRACDPPVLNLSFDKTDSKGNKKELFTGVSTYGDHSVLQYQKIRLIPECDIWKDNAISSRYSFMPDTDTIGFSGQLNVLLREYFIAKAMRAFGVPTGDIIGFANVTFVTPYEGYGSESFRYMIVQKTDERDDQIPFPTQFNLNPDLYESSDIGLVLDIDYDTVNRLISATLIDIATSAKTTVFFDQEKTLRFLLLSQFLSLGDMSYLTNEDWGTDNTTGKTVIIPHGFDYSFNCSVAEPLDLDITELIDRVNVYLPEELRPAYRPILYQLAREIFLNPASLNKMIELVNSFPYPDVNKEQLIEYLKIRFYRYGKYFNSASFASQMKQSYNPLSVTMPFSSDE